MLKSLDLQGCYSVTVNVLDTISELGRDMKLVDVSKCNISTKTSDKFLKRIEGRII